MGWALITEGDKYRRGEVSEKVISNHIIVNLFKMPIMHESVYMYVVK